MTHSQTGFAVRIDRKQMSISIQTFNQEIALPALNIPVGRTAAGYICHQLSPELTCSIQESEDFRVSPRVIETCVQLESGERVIISDRKNCPHPDGVDGVIYQDGEGSRRWLSHRKLETFQEAFEKSEKSTRQGIWDSWTDSVQFKSQRSQDVMEGLRPPQIGALHGIGSHLSLSRQPATVVMPTGTGKTETMLASMLAYTNGVMLIVVPSKALRDQTAKKLTGLGLLRQLKIVDPNISNPIVGVIKKRPKTKDDLDIFDKCNVIVSTMSALTGDALSGLTGAIANKVDTLVVDEAHHVAATTWSRFREHFTGCRILQFTATPFRQDGKLVDGKIVYSYPLKRAQQDGYFNKINFEAVDELDLADADELIAEAAVKQLNKDLKDGLDHRLMARCSKIERAEKLLEIYQAKAGAHNPVIIHSKLPSSRSMIDELRSGTSKIVVCVDMLGEGFDLPQLKIAAIHDPHKSLGVLLQFTGRFTRTAASSIGEATVVANIADQNFSTALERLYSEDADWNHLLSEFSSKAVHDHTNLVEFLDNSTRLDDESESIQISQSLLRPKYSVGVFRNASFRPKKFVEAISKQTSVEAVWLNEKANTLFFITKIIPSVGWSRSKEILDRHWDLFVVHYDKSRKLLFIHSSDKSSMHLNLAKAIGGEKTELFNGDVVFRTLANINRLIFQNIGVKKHGRRNLRFAMYTGSDVRDALTVSQRAGSVKSNLTGSGFENGEPVNIGCSYKGRVWSKDQGPISGFVEWCEQVGEKLVDETIDTTKIIENVLIPEEVHELPTATLLSLDWPSEILGKSEDRILLKTTDAEQPLTLFDIEHVASTKNEISFDVCSAKMRSGYKLVLGGTDGFRVEHLKGPSLRIRIGRIEQQLHDYLSQYPPLARFVDLSELDGNLLICPKEAPKLSIAQERFDVWDWKGTNIKTESIWKGQTKRRNSIQGRAAKEYQNGGFDVVFDDDDAGEAADLICMKEEADVIRVALLHCKFSKGESAGKRVGDVVEVCSQAVRSQKWKWKFKGLCRHIAVREKNLRKPHRPTRFLSGDNKALNNLIRISRFKKPIFEIVVVQPGISKQNCTDEQAAILAATDSFLHETINVRLDIICSS